MKQDPLKRLENTAAITAVAGVIISFWQGIAQSRQGEWIILGGICLTVAVFDNLLLIFARNRDPSKAHPMVFPLVVLMVVLLIIFCGKLNYTLSCISGISFFTSHGVPPLWDLGRMRSVRNRCSHG